MDPNESQEVFEIGQTVFMPGVEAIITLEPKSEYAKPTESSKTLSGTSEGDIKYVPWGENDDYPIDLITKVYQNPMLAQGMLFNTNLAFGDGILAIRKKAVDGKLQVEPVYDNAEINSFFENNDINGYLLEQMTDINFFYNVFPEIILNQETPRKIVELNHLEAVFSRWSEMDVTTRRIMWHAYSAKFGIESPKKEDIVVTPVLNPKNPLLDLKRKLGLEPDINGKTIIEKKNRYIIPITFPTPGRFYYQKPYWVSIIESGWYEFAQQIPAFKKALLKNQMTIKYHIQMSADYWDVLYSAEGIKTPEGKAERKAQEYTNIKEFLTDTKNTGKSVFSYIRYAPEGKEMAFLKITAIENNFKGGEYLEDIDQVWNILAFGTNTHPSLIGASPGKNTSINGTEARELFIIKQAMIKPLRDRILLPLYIVKAINKWPEDIYFTIPNLELTTLDKGTGAQKLISQPANQ